MEQPAALQTRMGSASFRRALIAEGAAEGLSLRPQHVGQNTPTESSDGVKPSPHIVQSSGTQHLGHSPLVSCA